MDDATRVDLRDLDPGAEHVFLGPSLWTACRLFVRTWVPQVSGTAGEDPSLDRREAQSAGQVAALRFHRPEDLWKVWRAANKWYKCAWRAYNGLDREF